MFAKAVRVGSIAGLEIKLDWSILVIFWLLTWSLAAAGLPNLAAGYGTAAYWVAAIVTTAAFFGSLLAHELSHCVVARRQGIHVRDVTLWLLGGVSVLEEEPATPSADLRIAIAGPAMSLALGFAALGAAAVFAVAGASNLVCACAVWLGTVNIILAVFNLVPAAPLDGGRVLRAIRWRQTGDRTRAAIDAARAGRTFAFALIALGFAELLFGAEISGIWLILLGWFLLSASHTEEVQARLTRDLGTTRVRELMTPDPITVPDTLSVHDVLHDYVLARALLVVSGGRCPRSVRRTGHARPHAIGRGRSADHDSRRGRVLASRRAHDRDSGRVGARSVAPDQARGRRSCARPGRRLRRGHRLAHRHHAGTAGDRRPGAVVTWGRHGRRHT